MALNTPRHDGLHCAALAGNALARVCAQTVQQVLQPAWVRVAHITALSADGQTVRLRPSEFNGSGYTPQLLNGAMSAELTGIDGVCDLRFRDVATGGQGAPLLPAFQAACYTQPRQDIAVSNVGGYADLTPLPALAACEISTAA